MHQPDVIVVGADLRGMAAACQLAQAGARVLVMDHLRIAGGSIQRFRLGGAEFQTGPLALVGRSALDQVFSCCRRRTEDYVQLQRVEPLRKMFFADGVVLNVQRADVMARQLDQQFPHTRPGAGFVEWCTRADGRVDVDPLRTQPHVERMKAAFTKDSVPGRELHEGLFNSGGGLIGVAHALEQVACELGVEFKLATTVSRVSRQADLRFEVGFNGGVTQARHVLLSKPWSLAGRMFIWRVSRPYEHLAEGNIFLGPRDGEEIHIRCSRGGEILTVYSDYKLPLADTRLQIVNLMAFFGMSDLHGRLVAERAIEFSPGMEFLASAQYIREDPPDAAMVLRGPEEDLGQVTEVVQRILSSLRI